MKNSLNQWAWRILLILTCALTSTQAWAAFNIYLNTNTTGYYIHLWDGTVTNKKGVSLSGTSWPGYSLDENFDTTNIGGKTWYVIPVTSSSINYIPNTGNNGNQTNDLSANATAFRTFDGTKSDRTQNNSDVTSTYTKYLDTYYATGDNVTVFGTAWSATAKEMTNDHNGTWTWTSEQFHMDEGNTIGFKVVKNGTDWIPSGTGNEIIKTAQASGTYSLKITYTLNASEPQGTLTLVQADPVYYTVAGSTNGTAEGDPDEMFTTAWDTSVNEMTESNGTYSWSKWAQLSNGSIAFKVVKNGTTWMPNDNITYNNVGQANDWYYLSVSIDPNNNNYISHSFNALAPMFSVAGGSYDSNKSIELSSIEGATIYYTTDGTIPTTSSTVYSGAITLAHEGEYTIKAIAVKDGHTSLVSTATYTIAFKDIYLFGSVGIQHAWNFSNGNYKLVTSDGVNYTGVYRVNKNTNENVGYFILGSATGITWGDEKMIGSNAGGSNWVINDGNLGTTMTTVAASSKPWQVTTGEGLYQFDYNRSNNTLVVNKYTDGISIFVYDYARPYIYVKDAENTEFNGEYPGANINIIDETIGGFSGLCNAADGSENGTGTLGWYEFPVPSGVHPITFQLLHNGDNTVTKTDFIEASSDVYYYWNGKEYKALRSKEEADSLRRIVAHVRVQGTTVPICDGQPMNGPSSFYGQMYYWMAVTTFNKGEKMRITDGRHLYDNNIYSDIYLEWTDANSNDYVLLSKGTLESRLANKTGVGTIIHLQKNQNTTETHDSKILGINTWVWSTSEGENVNTTNLGRTWWGRHNSDWAGSPYGDNYENSRFLYQNSDPNDPNDQPDVYIETSEDGAKWFTWYEDNSVASITFGYGDLTANSNYPIYTPNKDVYQFYATYESPAVSQQAGELWYVWTPDFTNPGNDNGELIDVTRTYESRAKQKAMCSTVREGNYVYYTDIKGWGDDNIFCYIFSETSSLVGIWPGIQMTKIGYDDEGHPVYLIDLSNYDLSSATGIIFNNGKEETNNTKAQTGNLEWENGGCYDYLGLIYRIGGNIDVIENEPDDNPATLTLTGVWYSRVTGTLFAKGDNDYNNKSVNGYGYTDYAKSTDLQSAPYDQSNWVEIKASYKSGGNVTTTDLKGLIDSKFTLYGIKENSVNPLFEAISVSNVSNDSHYDPNHFTPANFMGQYQQCTNGINYFFVEPKPNEFVYLDRGIYVDRDDASQAEPDDYFRFIMNTNTGLKGSFNVDWTYHDALNTGGYNFNESQLGSHGVAPDLINLTGYSGWLAIIKKNETTTSSAAPSRLKEYVEPFDPAAYDTSVTPSATYTVYPICITSDMATAIQDVKNDKAVRTLKTTRYYNLMGVESSTPFSGVNIVVKEYTDGTRESSKAIMR